MKPVYLEFSGINSFSEPAQINFSALLSGGVFGIFGDTGSGKSTILDSIHFALYGEIDRVPKSFNDCINYRSDAAKVIFDFEITTEGKRKTYRVQRERKRKTGGTKAYLYEYTDSKENMLALAEGTREVDEKIEQIIGLSFADFKMCIALPQGDFAALVKSTTAERVKLVSRLFNLEKYGEKLSKAVNDRFYKAEEEVNLIRARMEENEGGSDELIAQITEQITEEKQTLAAAKSCVKQAEEIYATTAEKAKAKQAFSSLCLRRERLLVSLPQMQEKKRKLELYPMAKAVQEKHAAMQTSIREETLAGKKAAEAKESYQQANARLEQAKRTLEETDYREKTLRLSLDLERIRSAAEDMQAAKAAEQELQACIAKYKALENRYPKRDFAAERQAIDCQLDGLGVDDTLLDYIKRRCKGALLGDVYADVQQDLTMLLDKYPQIRPDVQTLLKKYTLDNQEQSQTLDLQTLDQAFRRMEEQRKQLRNQADAIEKQRLEYEENESKKKMLVEQGKLLRENYQNALAKIATVKDLGSEEDLQKQLASLQQAESSAKTAVENAQKKVQELYAEIQKQTSLLAVHAGARASGEKALDSSLQESGFSSVDDALSLIAGLGDVSAAQAQTQAFFEEYTLVNNEYEKTNQATFADYQDGAELLAKQAKEQAQAKLDESNQKLGALEKEFVRLEQLREKYKAQLKELEEKEKHKNVCDELRALVRSNRFLEFIASEYLQEISSQASKTLLSLTGGRYFLKYEKEFKVGDNLDGGNLRAVKTLSGGETFLVSLSLALSLSATICLKSLRPIEFFFLDEGFGTLDGKLVDTVMDVLGKLSKTFAVGLISHVEELKHRIENKIVVSGATETHGSQVKVECY